MGKIRDARFDTLKGFLILSVVFGHFFTHDASHGIVSQAIANFIYSFHMPLFVFVSGYFANNKNVFKSILRILETYIVFQLIKGLWYDYSVLWLFIMPGPMLWYLFALIIWRLLYWVFEKAGININWVVILVFIVLSLIAGFVSWIDREFALSRLIFFAPYFFLGVIAQKLQVIDVINTRINIKVSVTVLIITLIISVLCAIYHIKIRKVFAGTSPYPLNHEKIYMIARLISYFTSSIVSIAFIRLCTIENKLFGTIGKDSLKYYMFHGLCLMGIEAIGAPWSTILAIVYAFGVSAVIFFFNKTRLSDFVINPISFIIQHQTKTNKNG